MAANRNGSDSGKGYDKRLSVEDFQDLAKIGGDILKRTVNVGLDVIKEVKDGLPKEASQFISARKDDVLKGVSKEVWPNIVTLAVDRIFDAVRQHKLEISIRFKKIDDDSHSTKHQKPPTSAAKETSYASPSRKK